VTPDEARELLAPAITAYGGVWADLGAGNGTFTRALADLVGPASQIFAVDRDVEAVKSLTRWAPSAPCKIVPVVSDFALSFELPVTTAFDGMLFANSLHYVKDAGRVLARLVTWLKPGGRMVLVEYDRRRANRWVPHPIPASKFPGLATAAGLTSPAVLATRPSIYQGELYVGVADHPPADTQRPLGPCLHVRDHS
jgi:SAM-dependent methyltransferase